MMTPVILTGEIWFAGGYISADYFISEEYTTNVQARSDSGEDFITTFNPGISYRTEIAMLDLGARVGYNVIRFDNLTQNDGENLDFQLDTAFRKNLDTAFSIDDINLSVNESIQRDSEIGQVTRNRNYNASINYSYRISGIYSISSGIGYNRTEPLSGNLNETESYDIPLDLNYRHSATLSYGVGYRFNHDDSSGGNRGAISTTSHTLYGFTSGIISPLVNGSLQIGAQLQKTGAIDREEAVIDEFLGFDEEGVPTSFQQIYIPGSSQDDDINIAPYISGNLAWLISNATSFNFGVSTNFSTTAVGQTNQGYGANVGLSHVFSTTMSGNLSLSLNLTEFSGNETTFKIRTYEVILLEDGTPSLGPIIDDSIVARISDTRDETQWILASGLSKQIGKNSSLNMDLRYTDNSSSDELFTYNEFSVILRFAQRF